jgi:tRNA(Ile)-lysidine synthase
LLTATRADVMAYLAAEGQAFREDRSNADLRFTRNRIRHELLPLLTAHYNPAVVRVLTSLAAQAEELYTAAEAEAQRLLAAAERPRAGALLIFDRATLGAAPRHLLREALRLAWEREGWPSGAMGFADWQRLADVACGTVTAVDLPDGIHARCRERVVQIGPDRGRGKKAKRNQQQEE